MQAKPIDMRAFRWGWTAFMVLTTSVPYLACWFQTPADHRYSWILPPYPQDSFAYMAWSQQAAHGSLLFKLKYTALPHSAFLFHPFFLVCGWISRLFGCDIGIVHWALKAVGVMLFFVVFYRYTDCLGLSRFQSIVASVLVGISSGFGGLFAFLGLLNQGPIVGLVNQGQIVPTDLWMPEVSTYWSLLWNPLFPYSLTLIVLIIYWLERGTRDARKIDLWLGGFATGILALMQPYALPMLFAYAVIITIARRGPAALGLLFRFFSASFPFVLYVVLVSIFQPLVSRHSTRGEMRSPHLVDYVLGFGFPLLISVVGLTVKPSHWLKRYWQLVLWFLLSLVFANLPWWFQRKIIFGAQIPLCILAGISLDLILTRVSWLRSRNWALASAAIVLAPLLIATPVYLLLSESREVRRNANGTYYISNEMLDALNFLKDNSRPNEVVFATYDTSRLIPAFSGNTVLWGHWAMSVDLEEREQWNAHLFNESPNWQDRQRSRDFWGTGIQYILADGDLRESIEQNPDMWRVILNDADKVFVNTSVAIYKHRTGQS
jgi:hypothetical protein